MTEAFIIGFDRSYAPIKKPVCEMADQEQLAAMALVVEEFEEAQETIEIIDPMVQIEYLPQRLDVSLMLIERCFTFEEVRTRMERLAVAVQATRRLN